MAEYSDNPLDSPAEERKRRLLTMYEMTGNPFMQGSPFSAPLRRGGASASYDAPPGEEERPPFAMLDVPKLAPQQAASQELRGAPASRPAAAAAADTSLTSIPTQGPQQSRSTRAPQPAAPAAADPVSVAQQRVLDAMDRNRQDMKMPDMTQATEAYRQRFEGAGPDIALGWLMQQRGGDMGREFGGQVLKNALAARQPQKTAYGTLDAGGFTSDPMKEREFLIARGEKEVAMLETIARNADTLAERKAAREAAERLRRDTLAMHNQNRQDALNNNRYMEVTQDDGTKGIFDKQTRTMVSPGGGAPGAGGPGAPGQFPAKVNPKATEDERRIASQVQRIVGSAGLMTPQGAAPGIMEAAVGAIPHVGDAASSAVRGASGTLGIGQKTRQSTFQSQQDIIDALLYISTGAAYNKEQLATMREAYMPSYTDNAVAKANKIKRLNGMIQSAKVRAGRAWTQDAENALQEALPALMGGGGEAAPTSGTSFPKTSLQTDLNRIKEEAARG